MTDAELPLMMAMGIDAYTPNIAGKELKFGTMLNAHPRRGRLVTPNKFSEFQTGIVDEADAPQFIVDFAHTFDPNDLSSFLYAFGVTELFKFAYPAGPFVALDTPFTYLSSIDPFATVQWNQYIYTARTNVNLRKITNGTVQEVDSHWNPSAPSDRTSGKYAVQNNGHLFLGYVKDTGSSGLFPSRVRWSDLNNPDNWVVGSDTEADSFDLPPNNQQITGLSDQRGYLYIFTPTSIWRGTYLGANATDKLYQFEAIYNGIGNLYHYAHIQVKDVDFFIGYDNFYMLNGLQLQPIGKKIWRQFLEDNPNLVNGDAVRAYHDPINTEISWMVYPPPTNTTKEYVFNYESNEWSVRNAQNKHGLWLPYGGLKLNDGNVSPSYTTLQQPLGFIGTDEGEISERTNEFSDFLKAYYNDDPFVGQLETAEFDLDTLFGMKEIDQAKLLYKATGTPAIAIKVGARKNQADDISWSDSITPASANAQFLKEGLFQFRKQVQGANKFIRFQINWQNTDTDYIEEFYGISLIGKAPLTPEVNR
jgi:hypothetical protein